MVECYVQHGLIVHLSIAGRVLVTRWKYVISKLLSFDRDLVLIPNVAIHMNRDGKRGLCI